MRRAGDFVVFLPDYERMLEDKRDMVEYRPPGYIHDKGALLFDATAFTRLRELAPEIADFGQLKVLKGAEAKRLLQFETPHEMLGKFPDPPSLRSNHVIACSRGALDEWIERLDFAIGRLEEHRTVRLRPQGKHGELVTFFLDDGHATEWTSLAIEENNALLLFSPSIVLEEC